jgi:hypothetical protein
MARYVLELCQFVMNAQELQDFRSKSFAIDEELQSAADAIQQRAFRKMFELEGARRTEVQLETWEENGEFLKLARITPRSDRGVCLSCALKIIPHA